MMQTNHKVCFGCLRCCITSHYCQCIVVQLQHIKSRYDRMRPLAANVSRWVKICMINKKLTLFQQFHNSSTIFWIYASARQLPKMPWVKQSCWATLAVLTAAASSRKAVPTLPTADHDTNTAEQLRPPEVNWEWPHDKFMLFSLSSADGSASSIQSINCKISAEGIPLCFEHS